MKRGLKYLGNWLNWLVPEWMRGSERLEEVELEQREKVLGNLPETDPALKALVSLATEQFQGDNLAAIAPNLTPEQRAYNAGRAAGVADLVGRIERVREERKRARLQELKGS